VHEKKAGETPSPAAVVLIYAELAERLGIGREAVRLQAKRRRWEVLPTAAVSPASGSRPRSRLRLASATDACLPSAGVARGYTPTSTVQKQMCQSATEASFGTHGHAAQDFGRLD
jgi:hypothetical protein